MSTTVDNRVVSMEFDNSKFEKNVEESLGTLKKLSSSLDSLGEGSAAGLEKLMSAIGNISFDRLADGVDSIIDKFSLFGQIGTKMVGAVADSVVDLARKFKETVDSLTVDQVAQGWEKYALKTTSVQTIMNATGDSIEEVSAQLDKLMWFTDETSYDFADMANSIGKFTSNGQDLERSVIAMEGISNWAALSGQSAQQASIAMYNLSQALSAGEVKAADWRSIELANMATQSFKETVLETAAEVGTLRKVSEGVYEIIDEDAEEAEIVTASTFRSMLQHGFFTSEVLMSTLEKYGKFTEVLNKSCEETGLSATDLLAATNDLLDGTKTADDIYKEFADDLQGTGVDAERLGEILTELSSDEYELGRKAFAAGQEAKTFADAINAVKDAASSAWLRVFENIFGNYEEAKSLWTTMANDLYDIFVADIDTLNDALSGATTSAWGDLTYAIEKAGGSVDDFEAAMAKMARESGYDIDELIDKYGSLGAALKSGEFGEWLNENKSFINKALDSLGLSDTTVTTVTENAEQIERTASQLHDVVVRDWYGKFGTGDERDAAIRALGFDPDVIAEMAKEWEASNPGDRNYRKVFNSQEDVDRAILKTQQLTEATEETAKSWDDLQDLIDSSDFSQVNFRQMIALGITSSLEAVINTMDTFRNAWREFFHTGLDDDGIIEKRANALREFSVRFANFAEKLKNFTEESTDTSSIISRAIQGVLAIGKAVFDVYSSLLYFVSPVLTVVKWLASPLIGILATIGDFSKAIKSALGDLNPIKSIASSIAGSLNAILKVFGKFGSGIYSRLFQNESASAETFQEKIEKVAKKITELTEKFENFKKRLEDAKSIKEVYDILATEVTERINKVKNALKSFLGSITKENFNNSIEDIKTKIKAGINSIGKAIIAEWYGLDSDSDVVNEVWTSIKTSIRNFPASVKTAIENFSFSSAKTAFANKVRDFGKSFIAQWLGLEKDSEEVADIWSSLEYKIRHPIDSLKKYLETADITTAFESFKNRIKGWRDTVTGWFSNISFTDIWTSIKSKLSSGIIGIGTFIRTAFNSVKQFIDLAIQDFKTKYGIETWTDLANAIIAKVKTALSTVKNFLVNSAKGVMSTLLQAFGKSDTEASQITENVFTTIRNAFNSVVNTLEEFAGETSLSGVLAEIGLAIINFFKNLGSNVAGIVRSAASWADQNIGTALETIGNIFTTIWNFLKGLSLEGILEFLRNISSTVKAAAILVLTIGLRVALIIKRLQAAKGIASISKAISSFIKSLSSVSTAIASIEKAKAFKIKVEAITSIGTMLLKVAAAIAIVVAAVWFLGKMVDDGSFNDGISKLQNVVLTLVGVVVLIEVLQFAFSLLGKLSGVTYESQIGKLGLSLLATAAAIILMIAAIKIIANTHFGFEDGTTVIKTVGVLATIVVALGSLAAIVGRFGGGAIKASTGVAMIGMAAAVIVMVSALKKIAELDISWSKDSLAKLVALAEIVVALGALAIVANKFKFGIGTALAFVVMASAVSIMAGALKKVCEVDFNWNGVVLAGMIAGMSLLVSFLGKEGAFKTALKGAVVLLAIAIDLVAIGHALRLIGDLGDIGGTIALIAQALIVMGLAAGLSGSIWTTMLKGSVAILAMSVALVAMGTALKIVSDLGDVSTVIANIAQALIVMAVAAGIMGALWSTFLIGAVVIIALAAALGIFGLAVGAAASGMTDLGAACKPFAEGLQELSKVDMGTLAGGLAKLAATFITLGLATAVMGISSGTKLANMSSGLLSFCNDLDGISEGLEKLSNLGKDGDDTVYSVGKAMTNLKTIFKSLTDASFYALLTDFYNGENNDRLTKAAESLTELNNHIAEIQNVLTVLGSSVFDNVDDAMDSLKSLVSGVYSAEAEAYGSDFSDFKVISDNIVAFGDNISGIQGVIESLASYGTEENKQAIENAIDILGLIIGSGDDTLFGDSSTGLIKILNSASSVDFSVLTQMSEGIASFQQIGPAIETLTSLKDLNAEEALKPIVDIFGEEGIITKVLNTSYDFGYLTTMSESLASFVDSFSKIPEIPDTILTDLIGRSEDFIDAGQKLLDAFMTGLDPSAEGNDIETTKLITVILTEFNNHLDDWKNAGIDAAAAFVAGMTEDTESIVESISTILSGVSASGVELNIDTGSFGESGGLASLLSSFLGGSGDLSSMISNLLGGKSISDLLNLDSLTGSFEITSLFTGLTGGTFELSSIIDIDSIKDKLQVGDLFSDFEGSIFDLSTLIDVDSLKNKFKIEDLFENVSSIEQYDLKSLINIDSIKGIINAEDLFNGFSTEEKIDLSSYVDSTSLSTAMTTAIEEAISGISSSESGITTAIETLMATGVSAMEGTAGAWKTAGQFVMTHAIIGIRSCSSNLLTTCKNLMSTAIVAIKGTSAAWKSAGQFLGLSLSSGISSMSSSIATAGSSIANNGATGAKTAVNSWNSAGVYLAQGLANGITAGKSSVISAAVDVALAAISSAKTALGEASPSKVFEQIGEYVSEGMAIGITSEEGRVETAANDMANAAISAVTTAQGLISTILEEDTQPVITPVIDLSEVASQAESINSIIGTSNLSISGIASRTSALSSSIDIAKAKIQNASSQPMTATLDANSLQAILANSNKPIQVNTNIAYEGSLAQLATILHPYIKNETNRIGPSFVNSNR